MKKANSHFNWRSFPKRDTRGRHPKSSRFWPLMTLSALIMLFFAAGCKKDDITSAVKPVSLTVQVQFDAEQKELGLPLNEVAVKISNNTSGQSYTAATDDKGVASFASVSPGNYVLTASRVFTAADYKGFTGLDVADDVTLNASANISLTATGNQELTLAAGRIGNLVFKQIYYAGSDNKKGAVMRDQFIEIYNNSNDTIYADSLYIGNTRANQATIVKGATSYDWSQSIGMSAGDKDPSKDFIYMEELYMIPGSGTDHPIAPGKSLILASTGINHQKPFTYKDSENNDVTVSITNPELTVDLSHADFEVYLQAYLKELSGDPGNFKPFSSDLDNPNVPNMEIISPGPRDWVMDPTGREDFVMFKLSSPASQLAKYPDPSVKEITINTEKYIQVPVTAVIDAVEVVNPTPAKRTPKRLPTSLDGEPTFVTAGQYSSQSLIRKIAKTVGDRIILQDTNNSANDFDTKQKADPSMSAASFTKN